MNQSKGFTQIIFVIVVIAIFGVGGYYLTTGNKVVPTDKMTTPVPSSVLLGWQAYRDDRYHISMEYRFELGLMSEFSSSEAIATLQNYSDYMGSFINGSHVQTGMNIFAALYLKEPVTIYPNTDIDNAFITLATAQANSPETCYREAKDYRGNVITPVMETIGDIQYRRLPYGDTASGHSASGYNYFLYKDSTCYIFSENVHNSHWKVGTESGIKAVDSKAVLEQLHGVLSTLRFQNF